MQLLLNNIGQVLGITVIHSLWQGLLVYLIWRLLLLFFPGLSSENKYRISLFALFSIAIAFVYTFYSKGQGYEWYTVQQVSYVPINAPVNIAANIGWGGHERSVILKLPILTGSFNNTLNFYLPYIAVLYLVGLCINLSLIGIAWNKIRVIKQSLMDARYLKEKVDTFSAQFNVRANVRVSFSRLIDVPCVIGYIKPILLLPITLTTLLSAEEIEAILLHELSHIKNNDYMLNLIQQVISVVLFFNPFAHLISRAVTSERENRCDDWVINITSMPVTYAHALVKLEETRYRELKLALAANGKKYHLRTRIERLLKTDRPAGNIRHLLLLVLFAGSLLFCFSFKTSPQTAFNFSGKLYGGAEIVRLRYTNEKGKEVTEKCPVQNGAFSFKGNIRGARLVFFTAFKEREHAIDTSFFLEPGTITVTNSFANLKHLNITGSDAQREYQTYRSKITAVITTANILGTQYNELRRKKAFAIHQHKSESEIDIIAKEEANVTKQLIPYRNELEQNNLRFITTHPNSYVSALQLIVYAKGWRIDTVKKLFNSFSTEVKNSSYGDHIRQIILEMEGDSPGKEAPNFTAPGVNGETVSLNRLKGKFILLNFWTSAQPSLDNAPYLLKTFKKYRDNGLDIIGIADDDADPSSWKRSIKTNGTGLWHQVLRGIKYNRGHTDLTADIGNLYNVSVLPTRILIARDGTIIGRYVGTEGDAELDKKLASLFD